MSKSRKKITPHLVETEICELINILSNEIVRLRAKDSKIKGTRALISARRKAIDIQKHLPKVVGKRYQRESGITKKRHITRELAEFLQVSDETMLSTVDVMSAISVYIRIKPEYRIEEKFKRWIHLNEDERNLQNEVHKTIIDPDERLSKLLNYDRYKDDVFNGKIKTRCKRTRDVRTVVDDSLSYSVVLRLIQKHFIKNEKE